MTRAEKWALEHFPVEMGLEPDFDGKPMEVDHNRFKRRFAEGVYEMVEKDLALTWEDVQTIWQLCDILHDEQPDLCGSRDFFGEVLRRFNETRKF